MVNGTLVEFVLFLAFVPSIASNVMESFANVWKLSSGKLLFLHVC